MLEPTCRKEWLADEAAMMAWGARLVPVLRGGMIIFLKGPLGAGKTTLVRGMLRALGFTGPVRSPTYALVESYVLATCVIHHFDLYRMAHGEDLEDIGARDYLGGDAVCLIEWPERAAEYLPAPDLCIDIDYDGRGRCICCDSNSVA